MCETSCLSFFVSTVHEITLGSPHVCVKWPVTEEVLPLHPSKENPWKSWHYRFSDKISTIFSGVPVKLCFYETAPKQCDSSAPAVPVLCSCYYCAGPVWAAEGTVGCRRLLNHSAHSAKGLIDRLSELNLQMVTEREELTVITAAWLWHCRSGSAATATSQTWLTWFDMAVGGSCHNHDNGCKNQTGLTQIDLVFRVNVKRIEFGLRV